MMTLIWHMAASFAELHFRQALRGERTLRQPHFKHIQRLRHAMADLQVTLIGALSSSQRAIS
jgi:hypothetical protein